MSGLPHLWIKKSDGGQGASPPAGVKAAAPRRMSSFFELVILKEAVSEHFRSDFKSVGLSDRPSKIRAFPKNWSKWQPCYVLTFSSDLTTCMRSLGQTDCHSTIAFSFQQSSVGLINTGKVDMACTHFRQGKILVFHSKQSNPRFRI